MSFQKRTEQTRWGFHGRVSGTAVVHRGCVQVGREVVAGMGGDAPWKDLQVQREFSATEVADGVAAVREVLKAHAGVAKPKKGWRLPASAPATPDDVFLRKFFFTELGDVKKAAKRYVKYWVTRERLFGPGGEASLGPDEKRGVDVAMRKGYIGIVSGAYDAAGRAVFVGQPGKLDAKRTKSYTKIDMVRASWIVLHVAMQDERAAKHGVRVVVNASDGKMREVNRDQDNQIIDMIQSVLPLRAGPIDICWPPGFFAWLWPIICLFLNKQTKSMVDIHTSKDKAKIMAKLQRRGLTPDLVPPLFGGKAAYDHAAWCDAHPV